MTLFEGRVVVGYDGSAGSGEAVDWAAAEASRRGLPLTVVCAYDVSGLVGASQSQWRPTAARDESTRLAADGADRARKAATGIEVTAEDAVGTAAGVLINASASAALVVVGTRGLGPVAGVLLGSVAFAVVAHAACPAVVVRGEQVVPGPHRPVVVGVDDSVRCQAALRYAAAVAADVGARLIVLCASRPTAADAWVSAYWYAAAPDVSPESAALNAAQQVVDSAVALVRQEFPTVHMDGKAIAGSPTHLLAIESKDAGLLVVGARGRGGFSGLHLGSVSRGLIHEALCPVTVVPAGRS
jgi:nucleotide-binding universal stress UspA family protein